ncbi:DUF2202 domain-containing protein [Pontiella agarivorans]|uniref:DUF2202 domain-containing protein n=1 Tax=Pontiella agarivorans TaxID=3038953 RepID=A0ABU5MV96_9BACT|nr:DUF2202 domain-containing protein [Pontiella agarivorans]MDZ8118134.1 DUF2202 domain-containing protein [Pontiella agarivorans]
MTPKLFLVLVLGSITAGWMLQPALAGKGRGKGRGGQTVAVIAEAEIADLLFMREEEKLARDVYISLFAEWGTGVFDRISASEQKHMDAVLGLINKYGLADPALDFGHFADPELQELSESLVVAGLGSELEALYVGALIEEVDMEDIVDAMGRTDKTDILNVYGNLLAGSENHLRAFVRNIEAITGAAYEAQWISQTEVDDILGR